VALHLALGILVAHKVAGKTDLLEWPSERDLCQAVTKSQERSRAYEGVLMKKVSSALRLFMFILITKNDLPILSLPNCEVISLSYP